MLPALESSVTVNLKGVLTPAAGAGGIVMAGFVDAVALASDASVPVNTVELPDVMTTLILPQRSVAVPFTEPLVLCVQSPGASVKVLAAVLPVFWIATSTTDEGPPGVMARSPPNLLMLLQVAAFELTPLVPSVLLHTVPVVAFGFVDDESVSLITRVPDPAVLVELVMLALKAESVPVNDSDSSTVPIRPVARASGVKRRREGRAGAGDVMVAVSSGERTRGSRPPREQGRGAGRDPISGQIATWPCAVHDGSHGYGRVDGLDRPLFGRVPVPRKRDVTLAECATMVPRKEGLMHTFTTADAADLLGVSVRRVRELASTGVLPARRVGRQFLLSADAVTMRARARPAAGRPGHRLADAILAELTGGDGSVPVSRRTLATARSLIASAPTDELARRLASSPSSSELAETARAAECSEGLERRRALGVIAAARRSWLARTSRSRTAMAQLGRPSARAAALDARRALAAGDPDWALRVVFHADSAFRAVDDPDALDDYVRPPGTTGDERLDVLLAALTAHSSLEKGRPAPGWAAVRPLEPPWVVRSTAAVPDAADVVRRAERTPDVIAAFGIVLPADDLVRA